MMMMTYSKAWKPIGANRMFYASEEVDRLSVLAHHEVDAARRKEYVRLWMTELLEDAPVIFLPTLALNLGTRSYVHGDRILAIDQYPARFAWMDRAEMERQGVTR
jgi:ABC-type transport system substrate-binding protein